MIEPQRHGERRGSPVVHFVHAVHSVHMEGAPIEYPISAYFVHYEEGSTGSVQFQLCGKY